MLQNDILLKNNELCLVGRSADRGGMHEAGLYLRDTRFLSIFSVQVSETPLETLGVQAVSATEAVITYTPAAGHRLDDEIATGTLVVVQRIRVGATVEIEFQVTGYGGQTGNVTLEIELGADFRDMFDVRGMTPSKRPTVHAPVLSDTGLSYSATGADGQVVRLDVSPTPRPSTVEAATVTPAPGDAAIPAKLTYAIALGDGETHRVQLSLCPVPVGATPVPDGVATTRLLVRSDNPDLDAMMGRADLDLAMLQTSFPEGSMPAAGIPWFIAPFGRDSLIVALQTMAFYPERVWATLQVLAANQGTHLDPFREEEPGKILHELRYGDMARSGQIPHTPYFGSVDSTPLFVMAFAQAYRWHQNDEMYETLIPHVRRALSWIEDYGDLDGDGLIEYGGTALGDAHISQQGWKDSGDSLHWANGDDVGGPIALVEVQGYVYAAYAWLADVAERRGDAAWAAGLRVKADQIRDAVETSYWLPEAGFYAQALDGDKRPVDQISSNPGHLLYCGLPSPERAAFVAERLMRPDMLTRWGIRTLSSMMSRYSPMSYHNGSIWPHDNSLIMAGLANYGYADERATVARALIRLSAHDPDRRLSELYCGFDDEDNRLGPVNYPVSCRPQAWAAGCGPMILAATLGLTPGVLPGTLEVAAAPGELGRTMTIDGIRAGGQAWSVRVDNGAATIEAENSAA